MWALSEVKESRSDEYCWSKFRLIIQTDVHEYILPYLQSFNCNLTWWAHEFKSRRLNMWKERWLGRRTTKPESEGSCLALHKHRYITWAYCSLPPLGPGGAQILLGEHVGILSRTICVLNFVLIHNCCFFCFPLLAKHSGDLPLFYLSAYHSSVPSQGPWSLTLLGSYQNLSWWHFCETRSLWTFGGRMTSLPGVQEENLGKKPKHDSTMVIIIISISNYGRKIYDK